MSDNIGKIEKVESIKDWEKVDDIMSPLGVVAEMYTKTLAYGIEVKRLDVEIKRIEEQSKIANNVISSTYKLKMSELKNRRIEIVKFYDVVQSELSNSHIERKQVLLMAQKCQEESFKSELSIQEKKNLMDCSLQLTQQLAAFGNNANQSLDKLVKSLPEIDISNKLLGN